MSVYRKWYKRLKAIDTLGDTVVLKDEVSRLQVIYDGIAYAICPKTLEAIKGTVKQGKAEPLTEQHENARAASMAKLLANSANSKPKYKPKPTYEEILAHQGGTK